MPRNDHGPRSRIVQRLGEPNLGWQDHRLIGECLRGNDRAWTALIGKYKNLIYSIPLKYGATPEDAADIFQSVCLELFAELPRLRRTAALRSWLITVTAHMSFQWKMKRRRRAEQELTDTDDYRLEDGGAVPGALFEEIQRDQLVREAVARLPARCQEIIRLLFFEDPPVAYRDLAKHLGLATGSIGFIRGRCLVRLQRALERLGF